MAETRQDLVDYIQYNFDDIPSFKLAVFMSSGKIQAKIAMGEVDEIFVENLRNACSIAPIDSQKSIFVGNREFFRESPEVSPIFVAVSEDSRIFSQFSGENAFVVYSCGKTSAKDSAKIKELIHNLMA